MTMVHHLLVLLCPWEVTCEVAHIPGKLPLALGEAFRLRQLGGVSTYGDLDVAISNFPVPEFVHQNLHIGNPFFGSLLRRLTLAPAERDAAQRAHGFDHIFEIDTTYDRQSRPVLSALRLAPSSEASSELSSRHPRSWKVSTYVTTSPAL